MRRLLPSAVALGLTILASPSLARAVSVPIDQAKIVTFDKPISTVYVGNPSMADVTVIDSHRVFVLGKAFGTTNLIALDANGKLIENEPLKVEGHMANTVTLNLGTNQFTYACAGGRCEAAPVPGDVASFYQPVMSQNSERQGMGQKEAMASNAAAGQ